MPTQRLYTRYAFSASASIKETSGVEHAGRVVNISYGGCRLATLAHLSVGVQVYLTISVGKDAFESFGVVVHCAEDGVGLMFRNESPGSLMVLNQWIRQASEAEPTAALR